MTPAPQTAARVARLLGWPPDHWRFINRGYTATQRYVIRTANRSAFVKIATTPMTARLLNQEIAAYTHVTGPFMPQLIAADADPVTPILIIEDLSAADWPPPWTPAKIDAVLAAIDLLHATPPDPAIRPMEAAKLDGWAAVAADPAPFLSLGLVTADWLGSALPALLAAEATPPSRLALCHFDLRSDNLSIRDGRALILDWPETCLADPALDLGFMLPSLQFEGGPPPETVLPRHPAIAAQVSGFFAARAGLPLIPDAPFVRRVQREQLSTALPWVRRALGV